MKPFQPRTVHRYFELADSFVEVRELGGDGLELSTPKSLDRSTYRQLVLSTCLPEFDTDTGDRLSTLFPEDPLLAEDLLYQLCVDVNPQLAIHKVSITSNGDGTSPSLQPDTDSYNDFLKRLRTKQRSLEGRLLRQVFGQDEAVTALSHSVAKASVGLATEGRPLGCFLFVGRTGTGKTELARTLGRGLGEFRRASNDLRQSLALDDVQNELRDSLAGAGKTHEPVKRPEGSALPPLTP
mgnify:CR=1 FL=1